MADVLPSVFGLNGEPEQLSRLFRLVSKPESICGPNTQVAAMLAELNKSITDNISACGLVAPFAVGDLMLLYSLRVLRNLSSFDGQGATALMFPSNRSSLRRQREILVDRTVLCNALRQPFARIGERTKTPSDSYILALNTLRSILESGDKADRLREALNTDWSAEHPQLSELILHTTIHRHETHSHRDEFLKRLRKYSWLKRSSSTFFEATSPHSTPYYLYSIGSDATNLGVLQRAGLDPKQRQRKPSVLLLDLTLKGRKQSGEDWRCSVHALLDSVLELYLDDAPPIFATTDDPDCLRTLTRDILREWDSARTPRSSPRKFLIVTSSEDPFGEKSVEVLNQPRFLSDIYGTELLRLNQLGYRLRKLLSDDGDAKVGNWVGEACRVLNNLSALPGQPQDYFEFLRQEYEGFALTAKTEHYDPVPVKGDLKQTIEAGEGGRHQAMLVEFFEAFEKHLAIIEKANPSKRRFDDCIEKWLKRPGGTTVYLPNASLVGFIRWRLENDVFLLNLRLSIDRQLRIFPARDIELHQWSANKLTGTLVLFEPGFQSAMKVLCARQLPEQVVVNASLNRATHLARQVSTLGSLSGGEAIRERIEGLRGSLEKAVAGHTSDVSDVDLSYIPSRTRVLDFTAGSPSIGGPTRRIELSNGTALRVFETSEIAVYDEESLNRFRKQSANSVRVGQYICVFSPELLDAAKRALSHKVDASALLSQYHSLVKSQTAILRGSSLAEKVTDLRSRMTEIDPNLPLPTDVALRDWIDIGRLIEMPRSQVRPHAPQQVETYRVFMKALDVFDVIADQMWTLAIQWTRSARIRGGAHFHQAMMSIIVDPYGAMTIMPGLDVEIASLSELAEDHIDLVVSNREETI
jgi:hypothetical protein